MTRVLSLPTEHREVAAAVESIATNIAESTVRAAAPEAVGGGEWVRFRWLLADGTPFFEGTGRCEKCQPKGSGRYDVVLSALSFDPRNEAMFERILLSSDQGPRTGKRLPVPKANGTPPAQALPRPPTPAKLGFIPRAAIPTKAARPLTPAPRSEAIPPELAARAKDLTRRLNLRAPALAHGRWTEERVLDAALRMGLDSLESLLAAHGEEKK